MLGRVMATDSHPHDAIGGVPNRLPAAEIRQLSRVEPARALAATASEWLGITAAIGLWLMISSPIAAALIYPILVVFIGARQHALTVIAHDASHFRYLRRRSWNDALADLLLAWPVFISVRGFRFFHGDHHRDLAGPNDGNRVLWKTHDDTGQLRPEWVFPKSRRALIALLVRRGALLTGLGWIVRGAAGMLVIREPVLAKLGRFACYVMVASMLTMFGGWQEFALLWIVPYCTWHVIIQYMRLIAEHSAVHSDDPDFGRTRTTIPTRLEALLILPRNVGYHLEHHWYPSVPHYRLPELHARLLREPSFRAHADISPSILRSMLAVTR